VKQRRILYLITDLDAGGAEKCCVQLAERLDPDRWSPEVCSLLPPGALADRLRVAQIPVHTLGVCRGTQAPQAVLRAARLMSRLRPSVVHTFLFHANVVGRLAARLTGMPRVIASIRVAERRFRYHWVLENLTCRMSHRIVCVSQAVADFTRRNSHVPTNLLEVIPNGIDAESALVESPLDRSSLNLADEAVVAVTVGRLDRQKGIDVLLDSVAHVRDRIPNLHLLIVGAGPERDSLTALAQRLGVESRCRFLGWRNDVSALMKMADMFVMPSRWEGMPNAILEAMAAGLPVIATRVEGTTELVTDGQTGRLVANENVHELANSLVELATNSGLRKTWGRHGREIALRDFSLARMVARHEAMYDSVVI